MHILKYMLVLCLRSQLDSALAKLVAVRDQRFGYDIETVSFIKLLVNLCGIA